MKSLQSFFSTLAILASIIISVATNLKAQSNCPCSDGGTEQTATLNIMNGNVPCTIVIKYCFDSTNVTYNDSVCGVFVAQLDKRIKINEICYGNCSPSINFHDLIEELQSALIINNQLGLWYPGCSPAPPCVNSVFYSYVELLFARCYKKVGNCYKCCTSETDCSIVYKICLCPPDGHLTLICTDLTQTKGCESGDEECRYKSCVR